MASLSSHRTNLRGQHTQRSKLCGKLGRSFPVGLGTSSRNLRGGPVVFVLSRNFAVTYTLFGYFGGNLPDFPHFWVNSVHVWANFEHFLTAFISRLRIICRSGYGLRINNQDLRILPCHTHIWSSSVANLAILRTF